MKIDWPEHGGKTSVIASVLQEKGLEASKLQDFSANINPFGIPGVMQEAMQRAIANNSTNYPDLTYKKHTEMMAQFEGVNPDELLLTNGGAEAIHLSASLFKGKKVALFHPSFSEYELACKTYDVHYEKFLYKEFWNSCIFPDNIEEIIQNYDAVYICRPNNPSGTCIAYTEMETLIALAKKYHTSVVVDEAFIHFTSAEKSVVNLLRTNPHLVILRSLTKIFAVPGIRLGYAIGAPEVVKKLSAQQIPWSVNAVALNLIECLPDCREFVSRTVQHSFDEKQWLSQSLTQLGFKMSNTHTNFYLLQDPLLEDHEPLLLFLAEKGILARHTYNFAGLEGKALRFAIRTRQENQQIVTCLQEWREQP